MNASSKSPALKSFGKPVQDWFRREVGEPTPVQSLAWPAIRSGEHVLVAAPTGSGKTLAAFLSAIDELVAAAARSPLPDECCVLYISPLKALSNDIQKNLQLPINGIADALLEAGHSPVELRAMVRTGDTSQTERSRMRRQAPHILVTTPESLFILLTSESGREMLSTVKSVIVDEIHALAGNKRGAHLALSLARLDEITPQRAQRIGLSATQKPIESIARYLTGGEPCRIVDTGHTRKRDLSLVVPGSPLTAVMANEVWAEVYDRLADLVRAHRTTLVFVNTRRLAERATRHLGERLGEEHVAAHHGSMAKEHRLRAEQQLKAGELRVLVATASLELGIDIGDVDLVCQIGSPRSIGAFLQRVGRSGHAVGETPRGRLFPTTLDELTECAALLDGVARGELDTLRLAGPALDVLAQQIVAEVASRDWDEAELCTSLRRAWPYRELTEEHFGQVVAMLSEGYTSRRGRRGAWLHRDQVNGKLRGRRGARLVALTNAGVIPDQFDYDVVMAPQGFKVGTLNEDFAFESLPGDIFQLGNQSYRILKVESARVLVEDARGLPPTIPFWFGEAPGRSDELSAAVSRLREQLGERIKDSLQAAVDWLMDLRLMPLAAAQQLVDYLAAGQAALGCMPSQRRIVFERFFDDTGDMHLVVHSAFGSRINRAWGLALRKRFCRKFNFELQASALEDSIVLSLGVTHSFPLDEVSRYLNASSVRQVLEQAVLAAPVFPTRWRWNASVALAIRRHLGNRKAPPAWQRNDAEDLMAVVFPDQIACAENLDGPRDIPDHPLVGQTMHDCLHEHMDLTGLERLLERLAAGDIEVVCADLAAPSPLAQEILNARPYAFLDDGDAEGRRTRAIRMQPRLDPADARRLRELDPAAIERVRAEAWPQPRDAEELHDALVIYGYLTVEEAEPFSPYCEQLASSRRAACASLADGVKVWVAAERLAQLRAVHPNLSLTPEIRAVGAKEPNTEPLTELIRGRLEVLGPIEAQTLAGSLALAQTAVDQALLSLEGEGFAVRGRFTAELDQWCERRLLARIHRYTLDRMRAEIEPVSAQDYLRFLIEWQGVGGERAEGEEAILGAFDRLEGFSAPAIAWESELIPARIGLYLPGQLDSLCAAGKLSWARLSPRRGGGRGGGPVRHTPIAFAPRENLQVWRAMAALSPDDTSVSANAATVQKCLDQLGASFFSDIVDHSGLLRAQVEAALGELVACGLANADTFAGLRSLLSPPAKKPRQAPRTRRRRPLFSGVQDAGRWSLLRSVRDVDDEDALEQYAWALLTRYGVITRKTLEREAICPPWRLLLRVLWRMEARGEIRGGRFIDALSGEQFALSEAVDAMRKMRKRTKTGHIVAISAADPINLVGILTPGSRIAANAGNRIAMVDGLAQGFIVGGDIKFLDGLDLVTQTQLQSALVGPQLPGKRRRS